MIKALDLNFLGLEEAIASYFIESTEGPILIETGPFSTIKKLEAGLSSYGYRIEDVRHVFITHIHLDHAGAAWHFAKNGANIYLHPKGEAHMHDPSRLMESARRIYKNDMDRLWGEMQGIDQSRLKTVDHGTSTTIGNITIKSHHTPGHAKHHIAWQLENEIFCGDVAGVKIGQGPVVPPCPPPDINIEDWISSIDLICGLQPEKLHLTHFGAITNVQQHFDDLKSILEDWSLWIKKKWQQGLTPEEITPLFSEYTADQLKSKGVSDHGIKQYEAANPSWMSVAGLIRYWVKKSTE